MTTRRSCKLKFLVEFDFLGNIRISVTGCVVTRIRKIKSKIFCRLLILQSILSELLFSTRNWFVVGVLILIINGVDITEVVPTLMKMLFALPLLVKVVLALKFGNKVEKLIARYVDIPESLIGTLAVVITQMILDLPIL